MKITFLIEICAHEFISSQNVKALKKNKVGCGVNE